MKALTHFKSLKVQYVQTLTGLIFALLLSSCENGATESTVSSSTNDVYKTTQAPEFSVIGVNDYEFMFNDTNKGGMINFGSSEFQQCSLGFILAKFKKGYTTRTEMIGTGDIDLTCLGKKDHYTLNESGDTFAQMRVVSLDTSAVIELDFTLASVISKTTVSKNNARLHLSASQLKTLLK